MTDTPELDKLAKIARQGDNQIIGEFLEWATGEKGYHFTQTKTVKAEGYSLINDETYEYDKEIEVPLKIEDVLAEYFEIDMNKVRQEREAVYAEIRAEADRRNAS